eukprot:jgi/Mesvir1/5299/Mv15399-RA.3
MPPTHPPHPGPPPLPPARMGIAAVLGAIIALNSHSAAYFTSPFFACVTAVVAACNTLGRTLHTAWSIAVGCTLAATSMLAVRAIFGSSYAATIATLLPVCVVLAYPDYHPVIKRFALAVSGMIAFRILKDENTDVLFGFKITLTGIVGNGCAIVALLLPIPRFATERVASSVDDLSALVSIMYSALIQAYLLTGNKEHAGVFLGQYSTAALLFHAIVEEVKEHVEFAQYEPHGWHLVKDMRATVEFFESLHEKLEGMDMAIRSNSIAQSELTATLRGPFHDLARLQRLVLMDVSIPLFSSLDERQHKAYADLQETLQKALKDFDSAVFSARGKAFYSPGTTGNLGPQLTSITATNFFLFNAVRYALSVQRLVLHMLDVDNTASTALRKFDVEETRPFVDDPAVPEAVGDDAAAPTIVSPRRQTAVEMERMIKQLRSGLTHSATSSHTGHRSKGHPGSSHLVIVPTGGGSDADAGSGLGSAAGARKMSKSASMRIKLAVPGAKPIKRNVSELVPTSGAVHFGRSATFAAGSQPHPGGGLSGSQPSSAESSPRGIGRDWATQVARATAMATSAIAKYEQSSAEAHRPPALVDAIPEDAPGGEITRTEASLGGHLGAGPDMLGEPSGQGRDMSGLRGLAAAAPQSPPNTETKVTARSRSSEELGGGGSHAHHHHHHKQGVDQEKPLPSLSGLAAAAIPVNGGIQEFTLEAPPPPPPIHEDDHGHEHDHDHEQLTHPLNEICLDGSSHGGHEARPHAPGGSDTGGSTHSSTSGMARHPWATSSNTLLALQHRSVSSQELNQMALPSKGLTIMTVPPGNAMSPKGAAACAMPKGGNASGGGAGLHSCDSCNEHRWRSEAKQGLGEYLYGQAAWLFQFLWALLCCCFGGRWGKGKDGLRRVRMSGDHMRSPSPKKAGFGPFGTAAQAPASGSHGTGHHKKGRKSKHHKQHGSGGSEHELGGQEVRSQSLTLFGSKKPYSKLHGGQKAKKRPSKQEEEPEAAVLPARPPTKEWSLNLTLELNSERVQGAIKKAGALVIAGWVSNDAFAAITVGFIVGGHVGASFHISVLRVQGAVLGAVLAYFCLAITGTKVGIAALLGMLVGMFGYIRGSHVHAYVGLVAAFMVPVIMLGFNPATAKPGYTVDDYVLDRIKFTVSGVLVYVAVELLIWPQRATKLARNNMIQTISNEMAYFSSLYDSYISMDCAHCRSRTADDATSLKLTIKKALPHLVEQINEAKAEPELWNPAFSTDIYMRIVKNQKTLLRLLVRLHSSLRAASVVDSGTELLYQRLIRPMQPNFLALRSDVLVILEAILWALKLGGLSASVVAGSAGSNHGEQPGGGPGGNRPDSHSGNRTPSMAGSTAGGTFLHSLMLMLPSYVNKLAPTLEEFDMRHKDVATELQRLHAADASAGILSNQAIYSFHGLVFTVKAIAKELVELELNCRNLLLAENMPSVHDLNTHEGVAAAGRALEHAPAHASGKSPSMVRRIVFGGRWHGAGSTTGQGTSDSGSSGDTTTSASGSDSEQDSDDLNTAMRDRDRFVPAFGSGSGSGTHNV